MTYGRHGHATGSLSPTYLSWKAMKSRCYCPTNKRYNRYGGRNIIVCDRWLTSFQNFLDDMGERPEGKTLDRIDLDGNYCKENCRWADAETQANNSINVHLLTFNGETKSMSKWARELGLSRGLIKDRINKLNWSVEEALSTKAGESR